MKTTSATHAQPGTESSTKFDDVEEALSAGSGTLFRIE